MNSLKLAILLLFMRYRPFLPVILLIILALIWGSSFILIKRGLEMYSPVQVGTLRMVIAFLCLLPLTIKHIRSVPPRYWLTITIVGFTGNGLPSLLFAMAQTKLSSSVAGVLNSLTPLFTLVLGILFFRSSFTASKVIGIILGLIGAVGLILLRDNGTFEPDFLYGLFILLASICYATSVNLTKTYLNKLSVMQISGMALAVIGPLYGYYLLMHTDFLTRVTASQENMMGFFYIVILAVFGTAISLILFYKLVQLTNALYASSVTYLIPIIALVWGLIDGEPFGFIHMAGMSTILLGVYLANRKTKVEAS